MSEQSETATTSIPCTDEHARFCVYCSGAKAHNGLHCGQCDGQPKVSVTA